LEELAEAKEAGSSERVAKSEKEVKQLKAILAREIRPGERPRDALSQSERARKAVCNAIERALEHIHKVHDSLWQHLDRFVERATCCCYYPSTAPDWQF
jgi:hypothetical protein